MSCSAAARPNPRRDTGNLPPACVRARILAAEAAGDAAAKAAALADRDALIEGHWWLARGKARSFYTSRRQDLDDLRAAAWEAMLEAAELFDPDRGFAFSTYLTWTLRDRLVNECRRQRRVVYAPHTAYGRHASEAVRELAARTETSVSLNYTYTPYLDGQDVTFGDLLAREEPVGLDADERDALWASLDRLPPTWKQVLLYRYWDGLTYKEIGLRLGVSANRIQQLEQVALQRLRRYLARTFAREDPSP